MPDGATLAHVRHLVSRLDFRGAQQVLHDTMGRAHQDPGQADFHEAEAAALFAAVLLQLSDPVSAGNWANYAYAAMRRLQGERDPRTLHALGVLAVTQQRAGALDLASRHYQQLVPALAAIDGPESDRTLAAKADAAGVEHALGRCAEARAMMSQVIAAHNLRHGPGHPVGIRMTARLAMMWRDCGDFQRAHELVAQARVQAAALAPEDETHRMIAAAADTAAARGHMCAATPARPVVPQPQDLLPPSRPGTFTPHITEWPDDDVDDGPSLTPPATPPRPSPVPQQPVTHQPVTQQPVTHQPMTPPVTPVPATPTMPPLAVYEPPPPIVRTPPSRVAPTPPSAPRPSGRGKTVGIVAMGVVAAVAVSLVVVAMLASGKKPEQAQAASTASPTPNAAAKPSPNPVPVAEPSGPVGNLRLTDDGDSILVTWVYPANAKGPIIISAAVAGEPMRPLQSLPAGTESYKLPGLDPQRDYCVTVAVAYRTDHVVMSSPACTNRKKKSP